MRSSLVMHEAQIILRECLGAKLDGECESAALSVELP